MILLSPDEKIVAVIRKHWYVFFMHAIGLGFFMVIPFIISPFLTRFSSLLPSGGIFLLFIFGSSIWLLFAWLIFFVVWTNNYLDMLIVTNRRIVDIEQVSLFHREVSSFSLEKIQDITVETHGMLASTLNFGNVHIQTAGADKELRLNHVPKPEEVRKLISDAVAAFHPIAKTTL